MLEMLCPLIAEPISVPNELVSIILLNFVEPIKSQRFDAYQLARKLLLKCCDTLKPYIAEVRTIILHLEFHISTDFYIIMVVNYDFGSFELIREGSH